MERIENRLQDLEESNKELKNENSKLKREIKEINGLLKEIQRENIALKLNLNDLKRTIETDVLNDENQPSFPEEARSTKKGRINETNRNGTMKNNGNNVNDTLFVDTIKKVVPRIVHPTSVSTAETVAFYAYMNSFSQGNIPAHTTLTFDSVIINEGNGYNKHDGVFIVPVNGIYAFHWSLKVDSHSWASIEIIVNGNAIGCASSDTLRLGGWGTGSELVVTRANAGDHVFLRTHEPVTGSIISNNRARSSFSGWLIHS
ncbi:collagen alpha-2(VIII) chain-like [Saccostrea cucullata]|uniref:collagen alpha-2(VIII) chain-like n=1 Tax=Saccostrea cuccullata TaxID=36930 RepID=UPI002ED17D94